MPVHFRTSSVLENFDYRLTPHQVQFKSSPLFVSERLYRNLLDHWQRQLEKKQAELMRNGIASEIKPYSVSRGLAFDALYVGDKPVMWAGKCITLCNWHAQPERIELEVGEISYPFVSALSDRDFVRSIPDKSFASIRPPLAVCTFGITSDNSLVLTVRGNTTNVYPGRYYGQGGNPASVHFSLLQHQLDELNEELLLSADEVIHDSLQFYGIIEDCEAFPGKPDLIGTVQIKLSSQELSDRFYSGHSHQRPPDVADIRLIPFNRNALRTFLDSETQPTDFCPPAHGGLRLISQFHFGK